MKKQSTIFEEDTVSVIITVYNGERFLADTIESVLNQTYKKIELILVDDGSQDATYDICSRYAAIDDRIKIIQKKNGGMSSGRAAGYEIVSKNNWVLFFDADDIAAPNMVEMLMIYKDADIVLSCFENRTSKDILEGSFEVNVDRVIRGDGSFFVDYLQTANDTVGVLGNLCGVLLNPIFFANSYRKLCYKKDVFPQNYLNDAYSIPRLVCWADNIVFFNNIVYKHRLSKYTDSRCLKPNALAYELFHVQGDNLEFYKENASTKAYESMFLGYMLILLKLWYQVVEYEDDIEKVNCNKDKIENEFNRRWVEFKHIEYGDISKKIAKAMVGLFALNKTLWKCTVGFFRYGIQYKMKT